jgi:hypothetical protein
MLYLLCTLLCVDVFDIPKFAPPPWITHGLTGGKDVPSHFVLIVCP